MFSDIIDLNTDFGIFKCFSVKEGNKEHLVLFKGDIDQNECLVRVHSECITGDLFRSKRCDCGYQLNYALKMIAKEGGVLIYLRQEGRDIGLFNKIKAYKLQDTGFDTVDANIELGLPIDGRKYDVAIEILTKLNPTKIKLLTNNPKKIEALAPSFEIERLAIHAPIEESNDNYLTTKRMRMNHEI
jgi:GTP cyclohydrolase II